MTTARMNLINKILDKVYTYPTKSKYGFIEEEYVELLKDFPEIHMDKFNNALTGITCMVDDNKNIIIYHCDIEKAILCGMENRELTSTEWD